MEFIHGMEDLSSLKMLLKKAATAETLNDFTEALKPGVRA
jgi:hypothetical protein